MDVAPLRDQRRGPTARRDREVGDNGPRASVISGDLRTRSRSCLRIARAGGGFLPPDRRWTWPRIVRRSEPLARRAGGVEPRAITLGSRRGSRSIRRCSDGAPTGPKFDARYWARNLPPNGALRRHGQDELLDDGASLFVELGQPHLLCLLPSIAQTAQAERGARRRRSCAGGATSPSRRRSSAALGGLVGRGISRSRGRTSRPTGARYVARIPRYPWQRERPLGARRGSRARGRGARDRARSADPGRRVARAWLHRPHVGSPREAFASRRLSFVVRA